MTKPQPTIIRHVAGGQICCDPQWEAAYERFETPEQEIAKFTGRLRRFGFDQLSRHIHIVEIFCGRGNGLVALERMGFQNLEGVDLSDRLLAQYRGSATLHLADCTDLPFESDRFDAVIVQGGLHHLPILPDDLDCAVGEAARVLKPGGRFFVIEPWRTPFLTIAHFITDQPLIRRWYAKGDALATMTERERVTYEQWLDHPELIQTALDQCFYSVQTKIAWGKLAYIGEPKP